MQLRRSLKLCFSLVMPTLSAWVPASAQTLPIASPSALASHLQTRSVPAILGFRPLGPLVCQPGGRDNSYAYICVVPVSDAARGGVRTTVNIGIFNGRVDLGPRIASIRSDIDTTPATWRLHTVQDVGFAVAGRRIALQASCHQALGARNYWAKCLLPIAANVIVITSVVPRKASTISSSNSSADVEHAAELTAVGAIPIAEFILGKSAPAPVRRGCEGQDPIFHKKGC